MIHQRLLLPSSGTVCFPSSQPHLGIKKLHESIRFVHVCTSTRAHMCMCSVFVCVFVCVYTKLGDVLSWLAKCMTSIIIQALYFHTQSVAVVLPVNP